MRFAVLSLLASVAVAACISAPRQVQGIRIAGATYSVQDGTVPCDVTTKVASICNGLEGCTVLAHSALCPMGDPAPTRQKLLRVEYACGGAGMLRAEVPEGNKLVIACPQ